MMQVWIVYQGHSWDEKVFAVLNTEQAAKDLTEAGGPLFRCEKHDMLSVAPNLDNSKRRLGYCGWVYEI